jgi:hypothetical protein
MKNEISLSIQYAYLSGLASKCNFFSIFLFFKNALASHSPLISNTHVLKKIQYAYIILKNQTIIQNARFATLSAKD